MTNQLQLPTLILSTGHDTYIYINFVMSHVINIVYRAAQNFDGKILTNLTNFRQFANIFPIKIFRLVSYLYEMNE